MTPAPCQLDYAPAPPRRRKWIRRGVLIFAMLAIGFCAWRFGPKTWRQAKIMYWQRACARYTMPPGKVVYEEDPQAGARLLAGTGYAAYRIARDTPATNVAAASDPNCWQKYTPALTRTLMSGPVGGALGGTGAFVFLHELMSPAGHRRIVCIHYAPETRTFTPGFIEGYNYSDEVIAPATWITAPAQSMRFGAFDVLSGFPRHPPAVRMYAGQVDPNDPSRFTIRYQMWGQEDVVDGKLNDNDTVTLTPRKQLQDPQ